MEVEVIRSAKRRKTISGRLIGNTLQVRIPANLSAAEERDAVATLLAKVEKKGIAGRGAAVSDEQLQARAQLLNDKYLEGKAQAHAIRWVSNQNTRWGSCTVATGEIRISDRLQHVPEYVLDSVIVHELVHTFVHSGHDATFYSWANRVPHAERAQGYLEAYARWGGKQ